MMKHQGLLTCGDSHCITRRLTSRRIDYKLTEDGTKTDDSGLTDD
jgi:hypothetical protein